MPASWPRRTDHAPGDPNFPDDINEIEEALNELNLRNPITSGGQVADGAVAALLTDNASDSAQALNTKIAARAAGVGPDLAGFVALLQPGDEYVYNLTDGAGTLLDIVSGVA